jgi:hypothetical protein
VQNQGGPAAGITDDSLTNETFADFYHVPFDTAFTWIIIGGISNNYVYDNVQIGDDLTVDGFFASSDRILFTYDPLETHIVGVNSNGFAIGDSFRQSFIRDVFDPSNLPEVDDASIALLESVFLPGSTQEFLENALLTGIDGDTRISGFDETIGHFLLTPVGLLAVSEPGSLSLLVSALGMLLWVRKRDRPRS